MCDNRDFSLEVSNKLSVFEVKKYYLNLVSVEFTEHFNLRLTERIGYNLIYDFLENVDNVADKIAEKVFLSITREFRVYCKSIKSYIIMSFDATKKHIKFITLFPLEGNKLEIKRTNMQQLLITI